MFVTSTPSNTNTRIFELDPETGNIIQITRPAINTIIGLAANPADGLLYVATCCGPTIYKVDPDTGLVVGSVILEHTNLQGLAIDEGKIYGTSNDDYVIFEADIQSGQTLQSRSIEDVLAEFNWGNVQGIEVFNNVLFVNIDDASTSLQLHEFRRDDFSYLGIGYTGHRAAGSGYDGSNLWLDIEGQSSAALIRLTPTNCENTTPPTGPVLSITNSPSAVEGDYLQFTVRLSQPVAENVTFNVSTVGISASALDDFSAKGGSRLFAPGETERKIWVPTFDDPMIETNEALQLILSKPTNAQIADGCSIGTILDNDEKSELAQLSVADAMAVEGGVAKFKIMLSQATKNDVKIAVNTRGHTATANDDYAPKSGTRIIPAGESQRTIFVKIAEDGLVEAEETFMLQVEIRSNNAVVVDGSATGRIRDR